MPSAVWRDAGGGEAETVDVGRAACHDQNVRGVDGDVALVRIGDDETDAAAPLRRPRRRRVPARRRTPSASSRSDTIAAISGSSPGSACPFVDDGGVDAEAGERLGQGEGVAAGAEDDQMGGLLRQSKSRRRRSGTRPRRGPEHREIAGTAPTASTV